MHFLNKYERTPEELVLEYEYYNIIYIYNITLVEYSTSVLPAT